MKYASLKSDLESSQTEEFLTQTELRLINRQNTVWNIQNKMPTRGFIPVQLPELHSLDGSILIPKNLFENEAPDFFRVSRRATLFRDIFYLRGTRYLISTNPTFELRQKLSTFSEDFHEALKCITERQHMFFRIGVADYIKNACLTILNSLLYDEKVGRIKLGNLTYQSHRKSGIELTSKAVQLYYLMLTGGQNLHPHVDYLRENSAVFDKMTSDILERYKQGTFSSRHITRPEATNPQVVCGAYRYYNHKKTRFPQTIIGLPSGSTELAMAMQLGFTRPTRKPNVLLAPVSFHSIKTDFDNPTKDLNWLLRLLRKNKEDIENKDILIVDDNSSTGKTIEALSYAIKELNPRNIDVLVAEADTIRSKIDIKNQDRPLIATPATYRYSISRLPISRKIQPKTDLKEIIEKRRTISCVKQRYLNDSIVNERFLIGKLYVSLLNERTSEVIKRIGAENCIVQFRRSFLSNFWPIEVNLDGKDYFSVEHAYQAKKFLPGSLESLNAKDLQKINRILEKRGENVSLEQIPNLFTIPSLKAGTSKLAANQLRILGYVRDDWDDIKIEIMTKLLIQKFSDESLYLKLQETSQKHLVEGNDWNDTFWGYHIKNMNDTSEVVLGRGRNALGRLLMIIRLMKLSDLQDLAAQASVHNFEA